MPGKEKILMIMPAPSARCGIAKYALQEISYLKDNGYSVEILPYVYDKRKIARHIFSNIGIVKISSKVKKYSSIIIQYVNAYLHSKDSNRLLYLRTNISFILFSLLCRNMSVVVHEFGLPFRDVKDNMAERILYYLCLLSDKAVWKVAPQFIFHNNATLKLLEDTFKIEIDKRKILIREHNKYFIKRAKITKDEAKKKFRIDNNKLSFLCIGFIGPNKGFHVMVEIFSRNDESLSDGSHLYIVGSLKYNTQEEKAYFEKIKKVSEGKKSITILNKYLDDLEFDEWLMASDYVIAPYINVISSGVIARAKLYKIKIIACNSIQITQGLDNNDILYNTQKDLENIILKLSFSPNVP